MTKIISAFLSALLGAGVVAGAAILRHKRKTEYEQQREIPPHKMKLEQDLFTRIPDLIYYDRFQLAVQPVIDMETGRIAGGEVLSRLNHPERGVIFPNIFIPVVEQAGMCHKFDRYIFRKTCEMMKSLSEQGVVLQYLSCNLSRVTLSEKGIVNRLARIADSVGVSHDRLALEIIERESETNTEQFYQNLRLLKEEGFLIFVDDLGAGVTSVQDLWSYPVDVVKIDRSLLLAAESERGVSAYRALRNLVVDLGCKVLCEGVETEEQHQLARNVGCHYGQGFLYYNPMDAEQFTDLMAGNQ